MLAEAIAPTRGIESSRRPISRVVFDRVRDLAVDTLTGLKDREREAVAIGFTMGCLGAMALPFLIPLPADAAIQFQVRGPDANFVTVYACSDTHDFGIPRGNAVLEDSSPIPLEDAEFVIELEDMLGMPPRRIGSGRSGPIEPGQRKTIPWIGNTVIIGQDGQRVRGRIVTPDSNPGNDSAVTVLKIPCIGPTGTVEFYYLYLPVTLNRAGQ